MWKEWGLLRGESRNKSTPTGKLGPSFHKWMQYTKTGECEETRLKKKRGAPWRGVGETTLQKKGRKGSPVLAPA